MALDNFIAQTNRECAGRSLWGVGLVWKLVIFMASKIAVLSPSHSDGVVYYSWQRSTPNACVLLAGLPLEPPDAKNSAVLFWLYVSFK